MRRHALSGSVGVVVMIVVGYPNIFPTTQAKTVNCGWLQPEERRQLNLLAKKLDTVTKNAVRAARRKFGRSRGGNNRGHPTASGQRAIAKAVVPAARAIL